jgi:hypothetical protein
MKIYRDWINTDTKDGESLQDLTNDSYSAFQSETKLITSAILSNNHETFTNYINLGVF